MYTFRLVKGSALNWAELDENFNTMDQQYTDSLASALIALGSANFKGNWTSLSGALNKPASVRHSSKYWVLLNDLADVTTSQPGVSADWSEINAGNVTGPVSAVNNNLTAFDGTTGKVIKDAGVAISNVMTLNSVQTVTGQKTMTSPILNTPTLTSPTLDNVNGGQIAGLRNKIINGSFDIWQRGTSFTNPNAIYAADRWIMSVGAATAGTATRQAFTPGQTDVPGNPTYFARIQATAATGQTLISQRVEDVTQFSGVNVTLTFWAKAATTTVIQAGYPQIRQNFGSGGSAEVAYNNPGAAVTLTTSWQKITRTFTLASIAGKTIGANNNLVILPLRLDGAIVTFDIAQVQLEYGSVDTPFEQRHPGLELMLCQRYYYRLQPTSATQVLAYGHNLSTTQSVVHVNFPTTMRIAPTAFEQSGTAGDYDVQHAATSTVCSSVVTLSIASPWGVRLAATVASGLTTGQASALRAVNTNAYLGFPAEL